MFAMPSPRSVAVALLLGASTTTVALAAAANPDATIHSIAAATTLVFVSHDLSVVADLCEDIVILDRGRVAEAGPTRPILAAPDDVYTRRLLASVPRLPVPAPGGDPT